MSPRTWPAPSAVEVLFLAMLRVVDELAEERSPCARARIIREVRGTLRAGIAGVREVRELRAGEPS